VDLRNKIFNHPFRLKPHNVLDHYIMNMGWDHLEV